MTDQTELFMREALEEAQRAAVAGEVPIGAVVVSKGVIVGRAHNETEAAKDATNHAELLAIRRASAALERWRLEDCDLYVTLEPCTMCIGAVLLARIRHLYFGCYDSKQGAVGSQFDLSRHPDLPGQVRVFPEVLAEECKDVLQNFFQRIRRQD
ncbi:MAG: tRNA adenosine(34) deaminase TadA [Bdellovibrionales bacterium]|nr:tRNA adenosine(34) deaminase TadA [Bdellovibrionales bacterium]